MSEERVMRKEELRREMARRRDISVEAALRTIRASVAAGSASSPMATIQKAGQLALQQMERDMDLSDEDRELMREIAREEQVASLQSLNETWGAWLDEANAYWQPMRDQLELDEQTPINVQPKDICVIPGKSKNEDRVLGFTAFYAIAREGDMLVICPCEGFDPRRRGHRTRLNYDVVLKGKDSPMNAMPAGKQVIRPWMACRIHASAIDQHPVARLYDEQHGEVLEVYEALQNKKRRNTPRVNASWNAAWRAVTRRLMA